MPVLLRSIKPSRLDEIKVFPRTRHRNVEKPALLVDLLWFASGHVRRDAAVHKVENEDGVPFLPFGGVDRRQDQIVFVDWRRPASAPLASGGSRVSSVRKRSRLV